MRSPLLISIVALCATACGSKTVSPSAARIREASESDLTDCTFLQKVQGTASDGDPAAATHAKNAAKEQAAAIGATHIKWIIPCCTSVEAEAYRCDAPD
ncbi:MAG TPA: hypothetical protein VLB44_15545 [Kofleriaceae bacterium]|nr:hypothetical protein [Kofleriaceae bacterium]